MSNRRVIIRLLLAIFAVAVAHLLVSYNGGTAATIVRRTVLLSESERDVTAVSLVCPGRPQVVLERRSARWRVTAPFLGMAEECDIMRAIDGLRFTPLMDAIGDQDLLKLGRGRSDLGLENPRLVADVVLGNRTNEYVFGSLTPAGDGVYVAVSGEDSVCVVPVSVLEPFERPATGFLRRALFRITSDDVVSVDIKRASGQFVRLVRDGEGWSMVQPREASAATDRVRKLLDSVVGAAASEFVWPIGAAGEALAASPALLAGYGLDAENAVTVTLKCVDGADRQVAFGSEAKNSLVYALAHNGGSIVTVDASIRDAAAVDPSVFVDTRLFSCESERVVGVSIRDGNVSYLLARSAEGWRLDAPISAPCDPAAADALVNRLLALDSSAIAGSDGLVVSVSSNAAPISVSRYSVLENGRFEDLRSCEMISVDPARVKRLAVTASGAAAHTSVLYDRDRRVWNVESSVGSGTIDREAVDGALAALSPLNAVRIEKLKVSAADLRRYGLEAPTLVFAVDFDRDDSVRRNVLIGDVTEGGRFATVGSTDAVFVMSEKVAEALSRPLVK